GGRVQPYRYNGTTAPPFTTFNGLYDRYFSHNQEAWSLPARWVTAADSLDLETPLNLVSTVDISGGSSGSPLLNEDLEVVGVVFDSNMEALPNEYLYRNQSARAVAVDARGILEALRTVYSADRLVRELTSDEQASGGSEN
ncbi:MAG: S46 family peptidase, partial [Bacteroidetes bacterium QS_3_64_15]